VQYHPEAGPSGRPARGPSAPRRHLRPPLLRAPHARGRHRRLRSGGRRRGRAANSLTARGWCWRVMLDRLRLVCLACGRRPAPSAARATPPRSRRFACGSLAAAFTKIKLDCRSPETDVDRTALARSNDGLTHSSRAAGGRAEYSRPSCGCEPPRRAVRPLPVRAARAQRLCGRVAAVGLDRCGRAL